MTRDELFAKALADRKARKESDAEKKAAAEAEKKAAAAEKAAAKKAADAKKKAAAAAAEQSSDVNSLFGDLADGKNAPKGGGKQKGDGKPAGQGNAKTAGDKGVDSSGYEGQIRTAIENKFYDASSFAGKTCDLHIKLGPDGFLIDVKAVGGDPALCQAAVAAANQAKIPKPPSDAVYQKVKSFTLVFKP